MSKGLAYAYVVLGLAIAPAPTSPNEENRACRKAVRRALKTLPPTLPDRPTLSPEAIQRRWIRAKCERCMACPDMVG